MTASTGTLIGYARVSTARQSLDQQVDALVDSGVRAERIYSDKLSGSRSDRPGLAQLLDYVREGDTVVVVGIDRLGRSAAEVMTTIKTLLDRDIVIRALRECVDSSTPTGRAVLGIMASLAELELELGRERRASAREARSTRGLSVGRPRALTNDKIAVLRRMHAAGEPVSVLAQTFGVSRATVYRLIEPSQSATTA
ncbi:recombinase family protein [Gordonia amicalis]|uniref:recombinase family protein n=1 Tax=Gordonia amicalis TaxID=89053 RepID=UPI0029553D3F|nr:recombinase family protein [Gordonia amicalis]MDV7176009.1 recombinase family protein [Gordonia amicalis]